MFKEFIQQLSSYDKMVDSEKLRRVILEEASLQRLSAEDFEAYRLKLFHTNVTLLDKAIEKTKHGL